MDDSHKSNWTKLSAERLARGMVATFRRFFPACPHTNDPLGRVKATIHDFYSISEVLLVAAIFVLWGTGLFRSWVSVVLVITLLLSIDFFRRLVARGWLKVGSIAPALIGISFAFAVSVQHGTFRDAELLTIGLAIVFVGLTNGARIVFPLLFVVCCGLAGMAAWELGAVQQLRSNPVEQWLQATVSLLMMAIVAVMARRNMRQGITESRNAALRAQEEARKSTDSIQSTLRLHLDQFQATKEKLDSASSEVAKYMEILVTSDKLASLGAMVAGVSHEMASPMSNAVSLAEVIKAKIERLQSSLETGDFASAMKHLPVLIDAVDIVERNVKSTSDIIQSFKIISVDRASERMRAFGVAIETQYLVKALKAGARRHDVNILCDIPNHIQVEGYPGKYGQIVTNLVNNAFMHAFPLGHSIDAPVLRFRLNENSSAQDSSVLEIVCEDNGVGVDMAIYADLFTPFHTTKPNEGGSGLGLSIARYIAREMGGDLTPYLGSDLGGAAFMLTLPFHANFTRPDGQLPAHQAVP